MNSRTAGVWLAASILSLATFDNRASAQSSTPSLPPYCAHVPTPSKSLEGAQTFTYRSIGSRNLLIHVFTPAGAAKSRPAALFFFGGGFRLGDVASFSALARAFAARGYVAAIPDYRVICRDDVGATGAVEDAEAAVGWLRDHGKSLQIDTKRIVLIGASAGGLLATSAALRLPLRGRPAALVLFNPVLDLETGIWSADQSAEEAKRYSPSRLPVGTLPPTIVFHGTADRTVPIKSSRDFCQRAIKTRRTCNLIEYQGRDHSFSGIRTPDPITGVSPADDTMRRTFAFLQPITQSAPLTLNSRPVPEPAHYTTAQTEIGTLLDDPAAKAVLAKHVPELVKSDQVQMARSMTLVAIKSFSPHNLSDEALKAIDDDLAKIPVKK